MRNQPSRFVAAFTVFIVLITGTSFVGVSAGQSQQPIGIDTYAITNARIFTVSGQPLERGTVVTRNGLIEAVGANISVPPDARIIDGAGLNIYPGLIDANTTLGMPQPAPSSPRTTAGVPADSAIFSNQTSSAFTSPNSTQPPGLQPEILAADIIRPGGDQIDAARNAGITTALTAPREGILVGQSALINLAGETPQTMLVRSPIALHVGFTPLRTGTYPTSLMGVFAVIRQLLLDARRFQEVNAIYERSPRGLRRPEQDKSLLALVPVLRREMPVVMYADREREIDRALNLAKEFNLRAIIAGGGEAWKMTDRLRAENVPVLLSLNFPRRTTAAPPEADPDALRVLRERVDAPKTAGRLAAANVRFAFQSGGMTNITDFLNNAAKSVENNLSKDEALRAMTLRSAEIFGVADRLGSIEPGKIANLTVTRGDLFDRNRRIAYIFIDGRPIDLRPQTPTTAAAAGSGNVAAVGASGTWSLGVNTGEGREQSVTLNLQQQGETLNGSIQGDLGSSQIASASISQGGDIRFTAPVTLGGQTTEAIFTGTLIGNEMRGTVQIVGRTPGTFTGTRPGGGGSGSTTPPPGQPASPPTPPQTPPNQTPPPNQSPSTTPPAQALPSTQTPNQTPTAPPPRR